MPQTPSTEFDRASDKEGEPKIRSPSYWGNACTTGLVKVELMREWPAANLILLKDIIFERH